MGMVNTTPSWCWYALEGWWACVNMGVARTIVVVTEEEGAGATAGRQGRGGARFQGWAEEGRITLRSHL